MNNRGYWWKSGSKKDWPSALGDDKDEKRVSLIQEASNNQRDKKCEQLEICNDLKLVS